MNSSLCYNSSLPRHQLFHLSQTRTPRPLPFRTKALAFLANPPPVPFPRKPLPCMAKRLPADGLAAIRAALRPSARGLRSHPSQGKAGKPSTAPLDTPRNAAGAGAGASSGRAEVRDLAVACGLQEDDRVPLSEVVLDCTRRWFQDTLKEARAGDAAMQVLVGQMYRSGYGVNKNEHKAQIWTEKASRYRSTVWKVSNKRPGYNASDSDSDDSKETGK